MSRPNRAMLSLILVMATVAFVVADLEEMKYSEARRAADLLEEDLLACFPFTGAQEFTVNDCTANRLSFIATTLVGATHQSSRITYYLGADGGVPRRPR